MRTLSIGYFALKRVIALAVAAAFLQAAAIPAALAQGEPKRGGTLVMMVTPEPTTLVGLLTPAANTYYISGKMTEGLVTYDWDFNPQPALATSWSASEDGRTISFKLREGVTWHDGEDFTSEDVKFSLEVLKENHPRGRATFANIESIDTPDPHTVVLNLSEPAPYLMAALAAPESPIVPKHVYVGTDYAANPNNSVPVGTGPFKFEEWIKGDHLTVVRNEDYWDAGKPYLDRIIFRFIDDPSARAVALETGEADIAGGNPVALYDVPRLDALGNLAVEEKGDEYAAIVARMEFNLDNEYLKHKEVREAIAHSVDRDFIEKNIWFGYAQKTAGPIHPALQNFYTEDVPSYPYDPKKAEELLDKAGFPRGADGVRFRLTHDYLPLTDTFQRTAEYLKQALHQVGIEITLRGQDFPTYIRRVYTDRDFDFTNHWMNNTPDPTLGVQRLYWSKNFTPGTPFSNGSGYNSPEADALLEAAQTEHDAAKRAEIWKQFARVTMTDLPDYPLVGVNRVTIYNTRVHNHTISPVGVAESFAEAWVDQ